MNRPKPAAGDPRPLPTDATDIFVVEAETNVTPMIRDSMRARLRDAGQLWQLADTRTMLVSRATYIATLDDFCTNVPGVANAIASARALLADRARQQRIMLDQPTAAQKRSMKTNLHDKARKP